MEDKASCNNYSENKIHEVKLPADLPAGDIPDKDLVTDFGDRKRKTWCSYMEKGFRETRDMIVKQAESDQ